MPLKSHLPVMEPSNAHEKKMAQMVEARVAEAAGRLDFSVIRDVIERLDFVMSRSDSQFLVRYVQWRRDHPSVGR